MKHKAKSLTSCFLALCMVLALIPNMAFIHAQDPDKLVDIPQGKELVYNAHAQVGVDENEGYEFEPQSGLSFEEAPNKRIYAGNYSTVLKLKHGYKWNIDPSQNNTENKTVNWKIKAAPQTLTLTVSEEQTIFVPARPIDITNWVKAEGYGAPETSYAVTEPVGTNKITVQKDPQDPNDDKWLLTVTGADSGETYTITATVPPVDSGGDATHEYAETTKKITVHIKKKTLKPTIDPALSGTPYKVLFNQEINVTANLFDDNNEAQQPDPNAKWKWRVENSNLADDNLVFDIKKNENDNFVTFKVKEIKNFDPNNRFQVDLDYEAGSVSAKMDTLKFTVVRAPQEKPTGLAGVRPTNASNNDGKITGTTNKMEYKKQGDPNYTACADGETIGLANGTYLVRYKQTPEREASRDEEIKIPGYNEKTPVAKPTQKEFTYNGKQITAFKITAQSGYELANESGFTNTATNVGDYKVKLKLKDEYKWNDNTQNDIEVNWKIKSKALNKDDLEFSNTSKTYDASNASPVVVKVKESVIAGFPVIAGVGKYNSAKVKEANKITFTPNEITAGNYTIANTAFDITPASITKASQSALPAFKLTFQKNADNKTFTATIPRTYGAEYSFDGISYSDTNTKTNCKAGAEYHAYIRKKADDNHVAGTATKVSKRAPSLSTNSSNSGETNNENNSSSYLKNGGNLLSTPNQQEALKSLLKNAKTGATFNLTLDNKAKLFAKSLEEIAKKDVTLNLKTGSATWHLHTNKIPKNTSLQDLNLGVKFNTRSIPQAAIKESFQNKEVLEMELAHNGEFGFSMDLSINVGAKNHNLFANVYYYNPLTKKNEFQSSHLIDKNGNVLIPFEHASSYAILVDTMSHAKKQTQESDKPKEAKEIYENKFTDVKSSDWFYDAVAYMVQKGFMSGVSQTSFAPDQSTSRAMMVTMLHRIAGMPQATSKHGFKDVAAGAYYEEALNWAVENKIVHGYDKDTFVPNDALTREQFATILMNFARSRKIEIMVTMNEFTFDDADQISSWAKEALHWVNTSKIVEGYDNKLNPKQNATRAQSAKMIMKFMKAFFEEPVPYKN